MYLINKDETEHTGQVSRKQNLRKTIKLTFKHFHLLKPCSCVPAGGTDVPLRSVYDATLPKSLLPVKEKKG